MKGISLFSSAGIAETYFDELNIDIQVANDIEKKRCDFYKHMYPNADVIFGDIQNKEEEDLVIDFYEKNLKLNYN